MAAAVAVVNILMILPQHISIATGREAEVVELVFWDKVQTALEVQAVLTILLVNVPELAVVADLEGLQEEVLLQRAQAALVAHMVVVVV